MIHGATIRRPRPYWAAAETATIPISHAQAGIARTRALVIVAVSVANADLAQSLAELGDVLEADRRRRRGDLVQNGAVDRLAARRELERCGVLLGYAVEVVLALHVGAGGGSHGGARLGARREQLEGRRERARLVLVDRDLERDVIG